MPGEARRAVGAGLYAQPAPVRHPAGDVTGKDGRHCATREVEQRRAVLAELGAKLNTPPPPPVPVDQLAE